MWEHKDGLPRSEAVLYLSIDKRRREKQASLVASAKRALVCVLHAGVTLSIAGNAHKRLTSSFASPSATTPALRQQWLLACFLGRV